MSKSECDRKEEESKWLKKEKANTQSLKSDSDTWRVGDAVNSGSKIFTLTLAQKLLNSGLGLVEEGGFFASHPGLCLTMSCPVTISDHRRLVNNTLKCMCANVHVIAVFKFVIGQLRS